ncbi:hypothetical protein [Geobacter sp. AOG2]|uniref:GspE/PulE/PilB domain-containing protein n=1 Tax=Geobacter sp. AOG2 TaxID=1566347 RepID=UPI001CC46A61|nr:hypothetical protein [Geobacter sp. AOG2]GFE62801.1 hypothetical protein AOG2_33890 [Geobacter sp. AOG2]
MARLGEILLSEKVLTARDLDTALENHVLHGVKLGTCLVEMGLVADDDLARCLGKQTGLAFLTKEQLLGFGARNLSIIPPAAIKKHRLIPVGSNGTAVRIATDQAISPKKRADLELFLGRKIEPVAVSGYAIDLFFEQMFGIQRPGRFLPRYSDLKTREKTPATAPKADGKVPPVIIDGIEWRRLGDAPQPEGAAASDGDSALPKGRGGAPPSLSDAAGRLNRATSRDDVARTVLDFLSYTSGTVALMIIKDGLVRGWKACSNRKKVREFETFSLPVESLPELMQCIATRKPYLGEAVSPETKRLLHRLRSTGEGSAFFPIFIQQQVVAVLLCDASDQLNPTETAELCRKASYALEILILRSKLLR